MFLTNVTVISRKNVPHFSVSSFLFVFNHLAMETRMLNRFDVHQFARKAYELGVRYIGGCCGFEPYHIRAIAEEVHTVFHCEYQGVFDKSMVVCCKLLWQIHTKLIRNDFYLIPVDFHLYFDISRFSYFFSIDYKTKHQNTQHLALVMSYVLHPLIFKFGTVHMI